MAFGRPAAAAGPGLNKRELKIRIRPAAAGGGLEVQFQRQETYTWMPSESIASSLPYRLLRLEGLWCGLGCSSPTVVVRAEVRRSLVPRAGPRLFGKNPRSHHEGATGRVRTGDQRLPVLFITVHWQGKLPSRNGSGQVRGHGVP